MAMAYFSIYVLAEESESTQTKVSKRLMELQCMLFYFERAPCNDILSFVRRMYVQQLQAKGATNPASCPWSPEIQVDAYTGPSKSTNWCPFTEEDRKGFSANLMNAVGKECILMPNTPDELAYKVVGISITEKRISYQVLFVECMDSMDIGSDEMQMMLRDSVLITG